MEVIAHSGTLHYPLPPRPPRSGLNEKYSTNEYNECICKLDVTALPITISFKSTVPKLTFPYWSHIWLRIVHWSFNRISLSLGHQMFRWLRCINVDTAATTYETMMRSNSSNIYRFLKISTWRSEIFGGGSFDASHQVCYFCICYLSVSNRLKSHSLNP